MKKTEAVFLVAVAVFAGVFAVRTLAHVASTVSREAIYAPAGAAGQARDVDMGKLERLLRSRYLSDHEAEFYRPAGTPSLQQDRPDLRAGQPGLPVKAE